MGILDKIKAFLGSGDDVELRERVAGLG